MTPGLSVDDLEAGAFRRSREPTFLKYLLKLCRESSVILVWYLGSSLHSIITKSALKGGGGSGGPVPLIGSVLNGTAVTSIQLLEAAVAALLFIVIFSRSRLNVGSLEKSVELLIAPDFLLSCLLYALANVFANTALGGGRVLLVQIIKCSELVITTILNWAIAGGTSPLSQALPLAVATFGIIVVVTDSLTSPVGGGASLVSVFFATAGAVSIALRNVLISKKGGDPLTTFTLLSLAGGVMSSALTGFFFFLAGGAESLSSVSFDAAMLSGVFHSSYNFASILFLSMAASPVKHAFFNAVKRSVAIITAEVFRCGVPTSVQVFGSTLAIVGLQLSKNPKSKQKEKDTTRVSPDAGAGGEQGERGQKGEEEPSGGVGWLALFVALLGCALFWLSVFITVCDWDAAARLAFAPLSTAAVSASGGGSPSLSSAETGKISGGGAEAKQQMPGVSTETGGGKVDAEKGRRVEAEKKEVEESGTDPKRSLSLSPMSGGTGPPMSSSAPGSGVSAPADMNTLSAVSGDMSPSPFLGQRKPADRETTLESQAKSEGAMSRDSFRQRAGERDGERDWLWSLPSGSSNSFLPPLESWGQTGFLPRSEGAEEMLDRHREIIQRTYTQFFEAASGGKGALTEAAVFGLADHENKGDAAINYGQAAILRSHDLKVSTFCASTPKFPCDFNEAERKIRETETNGGRVIVVATGGGNFGDLWGRYAEEREELIRRFPDFPILFFPQTVHFSNETNANRHLTMLASHPRLTVLARDVQSLEFLSASPLSETQGGNATLGLVPDSAEALHPKDIFEMLGGQKTEGEEGGESKQGWRDEDLGRLESRNTRKGMEGSVDAEGESRERDGAVSSPSSSSVDVLWLQRTDRESSLQSGISTESLQEQFAAFHLKRGITDPATDRESESKVRAPTVLVDDWLQYKKTHLGWRQKKWGYLDFIDKVSHSRLKEGFRFLQRGRVVVTDRLHGHLLCVLLGKPHVVLDNSYGKVRNYVKTWSSTLSPRVMRIAASAQEAVAVAFELLGLLNGEQGADQSAFMGHRKGDVKGVPSKGSVEKSD